MPSPVEVSDVLRPRGKLQRRCNYCDLTGSDLSALCTGCKVVRYCCAEHRLADASKHEEVCNEIQKYRNKVTQEEYKIRNARADPLPPANAFETHVGLFGRAPITRDHMRARFRLAVAVRGTGLFEGVQESLDHFKGLLRLDRAHNRGAWRLIPMEMLRLDLDQECYDFIDWYKTVGQSQTYDWSNMDVHILSIKDADVFESTRFLWCAYSPDLHHCLTLMLLKIKIMIDIVNIRLIRKVLSGRLPAELWQAVELAVVRSPLLVKFATKALPELSRFEGLLIGHVKSLAWYTRHAIHEVMAGSLDLGKQLNPIPEVASFEYSDSRQALVQYAFPAWWETEGALEIFEASRGIVAAEFERQVEDMMGSDTFKNEEDSNKTKDELLRGVSVNIWRYLEHAV